MLFRRKLTSERERCLKLNLRKNLKRNLRKKLEEAMYLENHKMSIFNEDKFKQGIVSELNLFELPPTQTSASDAYYDEIQPVNVVLGGTF